MPVLAVARFGSDLILPRLPEASSSDRRIAVPRGYRNLFLAGFCVGLAIYWFQVALIEPIVSNAVFVASIAALMFFLAELMRRQENYVGFYFLKAPAAYTVCFLFSLVLFNGLSPELVGLLWLLVSALVVWAINLRSKNCAESFTDYSGYGSSYICSILMTLWLWKEPLISFVSGSSEGIEELATYGRFKVIITFLLLSYNGTIPNLLHQSRASLSPQLIIDINRRSFYPSMLWGVGTFAALMVLVSVFFPEELLLASVVLMTPLFMIAFGNISAILNWLGLQKRVAMIYTVSMICFAAFGVILPVYFTLDYALALALAGFVAQILLSSLLLTALRRHIASI